MTPRKRTKRAVGYVRVSVDAIDKISPAAQETSIRNYAESKGWELVDVVVERGRSAGQGKKRPKFDRLMDDVDAGAYDALIAFRLDRVSRSTVDFAPMWERLSAGGCDLVSINEQFDTTTAIGRAMLQIIIVFAELERASVVERAKSTNRQRRRSGNLTPQGIASYGYTRTTKKHDGVAGPLVVDPEQAKWVSWIADQIIAGMSLRKITQALVDADAPVPPRNVERLAKMGKTPRWLFGTVRDIMTNPTIAGLRRDIDNEADPTALIAGGWEPIVDADRWAQLQRVLSDPKRKTAGNAPPALLSGHLVCGGIDHNGHTCGGKLRPFIYKSQHHGTNRTPGNDKRRYRCLAADGHPDACQTNGIDAEPLEAYVVDYLLAFLAGANDTVGPLNLGTGDDDAEAIRAQLDDLAAEWAAGTITHSEWKTARAVLDARMSDTERATRQRHRSRAAMDLAGARDVYAAWEGLTGDQRRAMVRDFLQPITVAPAYRRRNIPMAERVDVRPTGD